MGVKEVVEEAKALLTKKEKNYSACENCIYYLDRQGRMECILGCDETGFSCSAFNRVNL